MTRTNLYVGGGLALIILWLLLYGRAQAVVYAEPEKVPSIPNLTFIIDEPTMQPAPATPVHGQAFDWIGESDCDCNAIMGRDTQILDSISIAPRVDPGYYPLARPINIPPYLKGSLPLYQNPAMPDIPMYRPAPPSFWWGWQGLSRVIYTSDGATLRTGSSNSLYQIWNGSGYTEGQKTTWTLFNPITAIKYNGQIYQLDSGRSTGL